MIDHTGDMIDPTDHGFKSDRERAIREAAAAEVVKEIENDIRAQYPGMTDEQIRDLLSSHPMRGIDRPDAGYIYCPYLPLYVDDHRPWWPGILHWSWWVTKWRGFSIVRAWRSRRTMRRYAIKNANPSLYKKVNL